MRISETKVGCGQRGSHTTHFLTFEPGRGYVDCAGTQPPVELVIDGTSAQARVGGRTEPADVNFLLHPADQWREYGGNSLTAQEKLRYALGAIAAVNERPLPSATTQG